MRKIIPILALFAFAAAQSSFAEAWIAVQNKNASALTITSIDYMQFTANGTFTVDQNTTGGTLIIGTGQGANVTSANVVINDGCTLSSTYIGTNVDRPNAGTYNITGANGTLVFRNATLTFKTQTSLAAQTWNFNVGTFSLASKSITVEDQNYVSLGAVALGSSTITLSGNSSLSASISGVTSISNITLSGTSAITLNRTDYLAVGKLTLGDGTTYTSSNATTLGMGITGVSSIGNVVSAQLARTIYIENAGTLTVNAATVTLFAKTLVVKGTLNLNTTDAFYFEAGKTQGNSVSLQSGSTTVTGHVVLGADQAFDEVAVYSYGSILDIDTNGHNMNINTLKVFDSTKSIIFEDFTENSIYAANDIVKNEDGSLLGIYALVDGTNEKLYQLESGYLSLTIPEPAEWAAIFGALALGLAIYRRRNSK